MNLETSTDRSKLVILAIVGLIYSIGIAYLLPNLPNQLYHNDFVARWYASKMLLTTGRSLYDWANAYELASITGWHQVYDYRYYYPASLLFLTAPLSLLPYKLALFIWIVIGSWCLWLSMGIFAWLLKKGFTINRLTLLLVLMTTSVPVLQHTIYAQFNSLIALALALTYYALYRQKYGWAGLWAGGMLFKPQVSMVTILVLLVWSGLAQERRAFWGGLALVATLFWAVPELLEPNWVFTFVQSLSSYPPVLSLVDRIWNPYQIVSIGLVLITIWFAFRLRRYPASSVQFSALIAWTICLTALIMPIFGMFNIILMGPVFVILLNGFATLYPAYTRWTWLGLVSFFVAGLAAFVAPLLLSGPNGLQINTAEMIYRFTMPVVISLVILPLMFHPMDTYTVSSPGLE